jgi:hypothetical protein
MKKAVLSLFICSVAGTAYCQSSSHVAANTRSQFVWDQPNERVFTPFNDTIKAVLLISDFDATGKKEKNELNSVNGYVIRERYRYNNGHTLENTSKVTGHLTLNKEPISKQYIVWDSKEVE